MQFILLLSPEQLASKPDSVKLLVNWGEVNMVVHGGVLPSDFFKGDHVAVEGSKGDLVTWLSQYASVWIGKGHPMQQQFERGHIKQDFINV
jgi:hypothetical protein